MTKRAYRLLPLDEEGNPREGSQYVLVREKPVQVGDQIDGRWEVVELRAETGGLMGARDADGTELPLAGTAVCKDLRP